MPGINLEFATFSGNAIFRGIHSSASIYAKNADIGGQLVLDDAIITAPVDSLELQGAQIKGSANLVRLRTSGRIVARNTILGARLDLSGACIGAHEGYSIQLRNSAIAGNVFMTHAHFSGNIHAYGVKFGADLSAAHILIRSSSADAINLNHASIANNALFTDSILYGTLRAHSMRIGGELDLKRVRVGTLDAKDAVILTQAELGAGSFFQNIQTRGSIEAYGTKFGGDLNMDQARLSSPGQRALILDRATMQGNVWMSSVHIVGGLVAAGARIMGHFRLAGSTISCCDESGGPDLLVPAVLLSRISVSGQFDLSSLQLAGSLIAVDSKISQMKLMNASIETSEAIGLNLSHAEIGNVAVLSGVKVDGCFVGHGLSVLDTLFMDGVDIGETVLSSSSVGTLLLTNSSQFRGPLSLHGSSITILEVEQQKPSHAAPPLADVHGWKIGTIRGYLREDRKALLTWLKTMPFSVDARGRASFPPQPWKAVANTLASMGQPEDARWLRVKSANRTTKTSPPLTKLGRLLLAGFVGYGYHPFLVIPWLIALFLATFFLTNSFAHDFSPSDPRVASISVAASQGQGSATRISGDAKPGPPNYPGFSPVLYALDTALPPALTGQSTAWRVTENEWLPALFAAFKAFAWVLTALLLAGVTGILRKE